MSELPGSGCRSEKHDYTDGDTDTTSSGSTGSGSGGGTSTASTGTGSATGTSGTGTVTGTVTGTTTGTDGPVCGNGIREGDENCDGDDFGGMSCASMGYDGGDLQCEDCSIIYEDCCKTTGQTCSVGECCEGLSCGLIINMECG